MSCRNYAERMDSLRRCGCRRCEAEYYDLRDRDDQGYYRRANLRDYRPTYLQGPNPPSIIIQPIPKEPKMEEPKNVAIKILVDRLKSEQSSLASTETQLKLYETYVKTHRESKNKNQRAIKELATALKKLGHKDEVV